MKLTTRLSMFEWIIVILLVITFLVVAMDRLDALKGNAERVSLQQMQAQLQSTLNLEQIEKIIAGNFKQLKKKECINPFNYVAVFPQSYRGAFPYLQTANLLKGNWYFNESTCRLIYRTRFMKSPWVLFHVTRVYGHESREPSFLGLRLDVSGL